ncbi:MAG: LamG domain-containing protein [Verrucomicrobiaceae bacterium]|nr:LamG domain-containing protein [Verrucomicrobiaceae bacterium]
MLTRTSIFPWDQPGGANVPAENRIFIDTDLGDGLVSSYNDETDWALDGDGVNDRDEWNHVAMTFDEESQEITFYFNYGKMQSRFLQDTAVNGYTHPAAGILFGKYQNTAYELLFDEVRYSAGVLDPSLFLQAVDSVAAPFEITGFKYNEQGNTFVLQWRSEPGVFYSVDRLNNTDRQWEELEDALIADGEVMEFEDVSLEEGREKAIYRVRVPQ